MTHIDRLPSLDAEPMTRPSDVVDFRKGLAQFQGGSMEPDRWTGFRVSHGVYGQRQAGMHMIRLRVPGGRLPVAWLEPIARTIEAQGGGTARITTRQDIQIYNVPLERTDAALEQLHSSGVPTKEAGGNTVRNVTACPLAGQCPSARIDAASVANQLATQWIRRPLSQHLPRKVKIAVSGCAADCASGRFHDLAFIAIEKEGANGFRVLAGGGLGAQPQAAVEIAAFIPDRLLPAAVEAILHVHHDHSDRANRNASRIKFALKRLGVEKFKAEFERNFALARKLPQRPWPELAWRQAEGVLPPKAPSGIVSTPQGKKALVATVPLGVLGPDQLIGLAKLAGKLGLQELVLTASQDVIFPGLDPQIIDQAIQGVASLGLLVGENGVTVPDLVNCAGTTTCPIGITNAHAMAAEIDKLGGLEGVKIRLSGCQNSCGQHHLGEIGLHGLAKKIDGRAAPHYQLHLGGSDERLGLLGPVVPAKLAAQAVQRLVQSWKETRQEGEGVRGWAERLDYAGIETLLAPLLDQPHDEGFFFDHAADEAFRPPATSKGDCAAPVVSDLHLGDLARDALEGMERALLARLWPEALDLAGRSARIAASRLLLKDGVTLEENEGEPLFDVMRPHLRSRPHLQDVLDRLEGARQISLVSGDAAEYRQALLYWLEAVEKDVAIQAPPLKKAVGQ
jgi:sulfite reductase (ferredoxin)